MILSVHAVFGAAVASMVPNHPVAGFALGFVSHFVLDAIPHKDYNLISVEPDINMKPRLIDTIYKKFRLVRDITLVSFDALFGLALAFMFFFNYEHPWVFMIGALGSLLPDFLTFLYIFIRHKPLSLFCDFHVSLIHSKIILKLNQTMGIFVQFCTLAVLIAIMFFIERLLV